MALNNDEKKLLEELTARASAPDEDDDFEIEVYDTTAGKGARIPYGKGKNWLHEVFGIGEAPAAPGGGGGDGGGSGEGAPPAGSAGGGKKNSGGGYFGRQS
jgi:uncharacterized membrane protein YgcG